MLFRGRVELLQLKVESNLARVFFEIFLSNLTLTGVSPRKTKSTETFFSLSFGNETTCNSALKASNRIFNHGKMLSSNKTLHQIEIASKCFHFECNLCAQCTQCDDADGDNLRRFQSYITDSSYLWRSFRWIWLESINQIAECLALIMIRRHIIWKHRFF